MQKKILREAEQYRRRNQRKRVWRKFVRVMASIVVFCTTYLMILPAITMEKNTCGLTEHVHSETCYRKVTSVTV
jgi:type VI protein secretion system component VasF